MTTVLQTIQRLLPAGSRLDRRSDAPCIVEWSQAPTWPPDLFAVAATLVNLSGCYAHAAVTGGTRASGARAQEFPERVGRLGEIWREADASRLDELTKHLQDKWRTLLIAGHESCVGRLGSILPDWCTAALELMAIADEASGGIGFDSASKLAPRLLRRHWEPKETSEPERATATLCDLVPPEECCVQPKGRTPQVGCTLRSLTHHLALLPPLGEVTTRYLVQPADDGAPGAALNLLVVPFPFHVENDCFKEHTLHADEGWGRFRIGTPWYPPGSTDASANEMATFLIDLLWTANASIRTPGGGEMVHGIVLPELALDASRARAIAERLAKETAIELFIAGVNVPSVEGFPPKNAVHSYLFVGRDRRLASWEQAKHHRWRLDVGQIDRYGFTLDRAYFWWEDIDVVNREVTIYSFRGSAMLTTLICEDLARIDPVQTVVRAVGPNLLIALLMDGAQYEWRWPGRYATVLADDPGTSVLSLTCAGMVRRYVRAEDPKAREKAEREGEAIGLWKDAVGGRVVELRMPTTDHGLVLCLRIEYVEERTMDRRSDGISTAQIVHERCISVGLAKPPGWLSS